MTQQSLSNHPLMVYGWRRPPFWMWRRAKWLHEITFRLTDAWIVLTGRCSLHRAWQLGYDHGHAAEIYRRYVMKGN